MRPKPPDAQLVAALARLLVADVRAHCPGSRAEDPPDVRDAYQTSHAARHEAA